MDGEDTTYSTTASKAIRYACIYSSCPEVDTKPTDIHEASTNTA
jgi:hypothetical protein